MSIVAKRSPISATAEHSFTQLIRCFRPVQRPIYIIQPMIQQSIHMAVVDRGCVFHWQLAIHRRVRREMSTMTAAAEPSEGA